MVIPLSIHNPAMFIEFYKPVWHGYIMKLSSLQVVYIQIWYPEFVILVSENHGVGEVRMNKTGFNPTLPQENIQRVFLYQGKPK